MWLDRRYVVDMHIRALDSCAANGPEPVDVAGISDRWWVWWGVVGKLRLNFAVAILPVAATPRLLLLYLAATRLDSLPTPPRYPPASSNRSVRVKSRQQSLDCPVLIAFVVRPIECQMEAMAPSRGTSEPVAEGMQEVPRNPMPLSAAQEQQVRDLYYKRVRGYCAEEIKRLSAPVTGRVHVVAPLHYPTYPPSPLISSQHAHSDPRRSHAEFATCAKNRTVTTTWKCRQERLAMNSCMIARATLEEQDAAREEWLATRLIRKKEREEKDRQSKELQRLYMEWQPPTEAARWQGGADGKVGGDDVGREQDRSSR